VVCFADIPREGGYMARIYVELETLGEASVRAIGTSHWNS